MKQQLKSFYRYHLRGRWQWGQAKAQLRQAAKTGKVPIVIYTMGKVGSLSLHHSIKAAGEPTVFHIHTMQQSKIDWEYEACRAKGWWPDSRSPGALLQQHHQAGHPLKIVTLVREPIERNLSGFFEVFPFYMGCPATDFTGEEPALLANFLEFLPHTYPLQWLDVELKAQTGLDVYATPFDPAQGYQHYQHEQLELLLLRLDLPDAKKTSLLQDFLNIPHLQLQRHNAAHQKPYAATYQRFKEHIQLPKSYITELLNAAYTKHFYSEAERQQFLERWTKNS